MFKTQPAVFRPGFEQSGYGGRRPPRLRLPSMRPTSKVPFRRSGPTRVSRALCRTRSHPSPVASLASPRIFRLRACPVANSTASSSTSIFWTPGTAAQTAASVSVHGTRPAATIPIDAKPEDLVLPLMAFFHNRKYTVIQQGSGGPSAYVSPWREGALGAKSNHISPLMRDEPDRSAHWQSASA